LNSPTRFGLRMPNDAFDTAVNFVLHYEGELAEDSRDPGGLTKFGISQRAYPNVNIRALTIDQAKEIYLQDYWDRCNCDDLPPALSLLLFDSAVSQGPLNAIRTLQRALGVPADGVLGPITIGAAMTKPLAESIAEFVARRALRYATLPMIGTFGLGWFRRLAAAHQMALSLLK